MAKKLTSGQMHILREKGTEPPFSGKFLHNKEKGVYACAYCRAALFSSETKFDSGSGWPSFCDVISSKNIEVKNDISLGIARIEVICNKCKSHLGHLFNDGPMPAGKRYCINSLSLEFKKKK